MRLSPVHSQTQPSALSAQRCIGMLWLSKKHCETVKVYIEHDVRVGNLQMASKHT
jgi:hypothetical protein